MRIPIKIRFLNIFIRNGSVDSEKDRHEQFRSFLNVGAQKNT